MQAKTFILNDHVLGLNGKGRNGASGFSESDAESRFNDEIELDADRRLAFGRPSSSSPAGLFVLEPAMTAERLLDKGLWP